MRRWRDFLFSPEWVFRLLMIAGMGALIWLNHNYVTQSEYRADRKEMASTLNRIDDTMGEVRLSLELLKRTAETITDHETRIRALERWRPPQTP